jgi:hemin uptake protein HemP
MQLRMSCTTQLICLGVMGNSQGSGSSESALGLRTGAASSTPKLRHTTTAALLEGARELIIHHNDAEYRLRLTSNGKLILTK